MKIEKYLTESKKSINDNEIRRATEKAEEAFWASVASSFPDIKYGDFDPGETNRMREAMKKWVKLWVDWNRE